MKKKILRFILPILLLCAAAFTLTACSSKFGFDGYSFQNPPREETDWRDLSYGDGMTVDGKLDEAVWSSLEGFSFEGDGVTMTTKVFLGDTGVFFGLSSDETQVYVNPTRDVHDNTSMEVYLCPDSKALPNKNAIQIRVDALGKSVAWLGVHANQQGDGAGYPWTTAVINYMARANITGEVNSDSGEGYSVEIFMPYKEVGLESKPNKFYVLPAFSRVFTDAPESHRPQFDWHGSGGNIHNPGTYLPFEADGFKGNDNPKVPVGSYLGNQKTGGWEFTAPVIGNKEVPQAKIIAGGEQIAYYKGINANKYYFEATAQGLPSTDAGAINDRDPNESYPKMGIIAGNNANGMAISVLDVAKSYTLDWFAVRRTLSDSWNWATENKGGLQKYFGSMTYGSGVRMGVLRNEADFYYFINGQFVGKTSYDFFGDDPTVVGLIAFGFKATFTNFISVTDADEVASMLAAVEGTKYGWTWTGDFKPINATAVMVGTSGMTVPGQTVSGGPGAGGVDGNRGYAAGNFDIGDRKITKEANLSGDFTLSFTLTKRTKSNTIPNWMKPSFTVWLEKENGTADRVVLYPGLYSGDGVLSQNGYVQINPDKAEVEALNNGKDLAAHDYISGNIAVTIARHGNDLSVTIDGETFTKTLTNSNYTAFGFSGSYIGFTVKDIAATEAQTHTVSINTPQNGTAILSKTSASAGETVTVTVTPSSGYKASSITVNNVEKRSELVGNELRIVVEGETTIVVTFEAVSATTHTVDGTMLNTAGRTLTGNVNLRFNDGGAEIVVPVENGRYSQPLPEGAYTVTASYEGNDYYETYTGNVTVNADATHDVVFLPKSPVVDGNLDEWTATGMHGVSAQGIASGDKSKTATWYATLRKDGLYVAVVACHDEFKYGDGEWWKNTNLELYMGSANNDNPAEHLYVYFTGQNAISKGGNIGSAQYTQTANTASDTNYKTIIEAFIPRNVIPTSQIVTGDGGVEYVRLGVAWKTAGERISGGGVNCDGNDDWYAPLDSFPNDPARFLYALDTGIYTKADYDHADARYGKATVKTEKTITLNHDLDDWSGLQTLTVTGSGDVASHSVTFYGLLSKSGLYLAVDAHHSTYNYTEGAWHEKANFEFFLGTYTISGDNNQMFHQYYAYATKAAGVDSFSGSADFIQVSSQTTESGGKYHTIVEVFIPMEYLPDAMICNQGIRVGVAWKSVTDQINNGGANHGGLDTYWVPQGTWPKNGDMAVVDGAGIHVKNGYTAPNA